ncbi:MAG: alginate lyase family protein [Candidatus Symbiothrix sp.]|jgi:hypothetical protein|nr:alginate lyase family protein [Candidatus Symbiothrix sp.]
MKKPLLFFLLTTAVAMCCFRLEAQNFVHPGGLVSQDDIERIQYLREVEKDATIVAAYNKLQANSHAKSTYSPNPQVRVDRGGDEFSDNYTIAMNDAAAAFQNALMWRITGITAHADCAVRILNGWAKTCTNITGDTNASLASGIYGYEFAQAGELLRGYSGWADADFKAYQNWMRDLWYLRALYFLDFRHGRTCATNEGAHYMSNWGLCNALAVMSIGILCDDVDMYNRGLHYYKDDICGNFTDEYRNPIRATGNNEFLGNLVNWLHLDARGPYGYLGQMQESGRDQSHAMMAAGLAADVCQTAWNQGDDLYSFMNNRIAAGFEYIALVNSLASETIVADSVPFQPYSRVGLAAEGYEMTANGLTGWGASRPYWDKIVAHYGYYKGVNMTYSRKMKTKVGVDGGGGDYGSNSGGYDHLGFSTIINYIPQTWYPAANMVPVVVTPHIIYNGITINDNRKSGVTAGSSITLSPTLPEGVTGGTWKWDSGETTRELTFNVQNSGIHRVVYTATNGRTTKQAFNISVWGDCIPDKIHPSISVGDVTYEDSVVTVLPYQAFTLKIRNFVWGETRFASSIKWSTGTSNNSLSCTVSGGVRSDSTLWCEYTNLGGAVTRVNYHLKIVYVTPSHAIDGGSDVSGSQIPLEAGQSVELKPVTVTGYNGGAFHWNTGHHSQNLLLLNVQKGAKYTTCYTLTKNGVTTVDTLEFTVGVKKNVYQLANGDYYIRRASDGAYLTNPNATASEKIKPLFVAEHNTADSLSQIWTISKETASDAGGRFKIVSKKNGNYINENCEFGTNPYYSAWNTYTFYAVEGADLYAIRNGGSSGTMYWTISGDQIVGKGASAQDGYPFLIQSVNGSYPLTPPDEGENIISYIAPAYSVNGGKSQRGSTISLEAGKSLILKPYKVSGLSGGSWLWSDNSTAATLDLGTVNSSGVYTVTFTYPEADSTYVFPLTFTVSVPSDLPAVEQGKIAIYPNPVKDNLVIAGLTRNPLQNVQIYDITGVRISTPLPVGEGQGVRINVSHLPSGIYFIKIGAWTGKFIKH